jgi:lipoyl synthase
MSGAAAGRRKPSWLKVKAPEPRQYRATGALLDELGLHTVCREARCPNKSECYSSGTATFLILGDTCTRRCRFCAVRHAGPESAGVPAGAAAGLCAVDGDEPRRVAEAARRLGLRHVVITSVTRDDLPGSRAASPRRPGVWVCATSSSRVSRATTFPAAGRRRLPPSSKPCAPHCRRPRSKC